MPHSFVDLSIFLDNEVRSGPPAFAPKIEYFTHENTFAQIEPFFPGLKQEDLPDGEGWASGFVISCFPNKIRGAAAGWTRAVAIFDDKLPAP